MAGDQKRTDKQLKAPKPGGKKAKKSAGAKYLQEALVNPPNAPKAGAAGRKS